MTSVQTMFATSLWLGAVIALVGGCAKHDRYGPLTEPHVLVAPYDTSQGQVLWAVVPLRNESGTSAADPLEISDAVVAAAAQVRGVRAKPLNSTIAAMRALKMDRVDNPTQAKALAAEMGVDGLILGSITAYDPYDPPVLGLALVLYARGGPMDTRGSAQLDTRTLVYQPTDYRYFSRSTFNDAPASAVSEHLDARNQGVQMLLRRYAEGRIDSKSALGWRTYMASMGLYTQFAAHHTVGRLLDHEWLRLARSVNRDSTPR